MRLRSARRLVKNSMDDCSGAIGSASRIAVGDRAHDRAADDDRIAAVAQRLVVRMLGDAKPDSKRFLHFLADFAESLEQRGIELFARAGNAGGRYVIDEIIARMIDRRDPRIGG